MNPKQALYEWSSLFAKGGYLIILFLMKTYMNSTIGFHYGTMVTNILLDLEKNKSWSPVSVDIVSLVDNLSGFEIVSASIQDKNFNYDFFKRKKI